MISMTFKGEDDPKWLRLIQKWILHPNFSQIRGITLDYSPKIVNFGFFTIIEVGHIGFHHDVIRDHLGDKHLGDFSCPGTPLLIGSEKSP